MTRHSVTQATSYVFMVVVLTAVLLLHMLVPLIAGLVVFKLVEAAVPAMEKMTSNTVGRTLAVASFAVGVALVVGIGVFSLSAFVRHQAAAMPSLAGHAASIVDSIRTSLPAALAVYIPQDFGAVKGMAGGWTHEHLPEIQMMGLHTVKMLAETLIALIIACALSLKQIQPAEPTKELAAALSARIRQFSKAFSRVALAQFTISSVNTSLAALYLLVVLPLFGISLPLTKTMILVTFIAGMLPVVGNLVSNTLIVGVSLGHSLGLGLASLGFLMAIHKLEYVLSARIVGSRVKAKVWELLLAMLVMESVFGVPGLVAAPIFYAYLKAELLDAKLV